MNAQAGMFNVSLLPVVLQQQPNAPNIDMHSCYCSHTESFQLQADDASIDELKSCIFIIIH